jgi:hypothetical protein
VHAPSTPPPTGLERGQPVAQCPNCSAAIAPDQRYCLRCGQRLSAPRVDFHTALGLRSAAPPPPPRRSGWDQRAPLITLATVAAVLLALGVGVVIGRGNRPSTSSSKPTVVTVAGAPGAQASAAAAPASTAPSAGSAVSVTSISEDWPAGKSGWTVELSSLDKRGAQASDVQAAKSAATRNGARNVGVLDGDRHSGTPTGKYVIYSGQFTSQKQAEAAQKRLAKDFPGALVLHVTPKGPGAAGNPASTGQQSAQVSQISHLSGNAYEQASKKLPSQLGTGGTPPPKDNKAPGAGGTATCIGC